MLNKIWNSIKLFFARIFIASWYVWIALILAIISGWIWSWDISVWVFFGICLAFVAFILFRQAWWYISGTGDYQGREGFLKKLWNKVFKK